jgi:chemotaxis signal transduction protein
MSGKEAISDMAVELRDAFDGGFGDEPAELAERPLEFLLISVAGNSYLVELGEVAGVHAGPSISPFPSAMRELLGLTGIRGEPVPVFSLAMLLGLDAGASKPDWIILSRARDAVSFAFDALEGHLAIGRGDVAAIEAGDGPRHVRATGLAAGVRRPILSLGLLLDELRSGADGLANRGRGST